MPGAIGFGILLVGLAILVFTFGERDILGMTPDQFARVTALAAFLLLLSGSVFGRYRGRMSDAFRAIVIWVAIIVALMTIYTYRFELETVVSRVLGEAAPGMTRVTQPGEVMVTRGGTGGFVLDGAANGASMRFIFDTGADVVVVTMDDARRIGYEPDDLRFVVPVVTANGRTMTAPITLDSLTIGDITQTRVRALVARPEALSHNLLGMSFLDGLASYEVRGNQLILRGR